MYPNPTQGLIAIKGMNSPVSFELIDISGKTILMGKTEGQIDITNLPTGSYQLIITNEDGRSVHTIQKI